CPLPPSLLFGVVVSFFFNDPATTLIYTLSLHDALPISCAGPRRPTIRISRTVEEPIASIPGSVVSVGASSSGVSASMRAILIVRSEEHTSELQSRRDLVCRLLLEKKKRY